MSELAGARGQKGAMQEAPAWAALPAPVTRGLVRARFNGDIVYLTPTGTRWLGDRRKSGKDGNVNMPVPSRSTA